MSCKRLASAVRRPIYGAEDVPTLQPRGLDLMVFQCWASAVGGGPILKQHWVKSSWLLGMYGTITGSIPV